MLFISGNRPSNPLAGIGCMLFTGLIIVGMFYFLNWLYFKLWYATPVFIAIALAINWRIVVSSLRGYWQLLLRNPISGFISGLMAAFLLPFLSIGWVLAALGANKFAKMQQDFGKQWGFGAFDPSKVNASGDTEYVEFEEIESKKGSNNKAS